MSDYPVVWKYPLVDTTENKSTDRTGTPFGVSRELIGVSGAVEGGPDVFEGYRFLLEMTLGYSGAGDTIDGFFPITWRLDATQYAHGFIYRVVNAAGNSCRYHVYLRIGRSTQWVTSADYGYANGLIQEDYAGEQMDVQAFGPFVYVGREGKDMFMFYLGLTAGGSGSSSSSSGSATCDVDPFVWTLNVLTELGPGPQPLFRNPVKNGCSVYNLQPADTVHQDMKDVVTVMNAPAGGEDAEARILHFGFTGASHVSTDNLNFITNPYLPVRTPSPAYAKACPGPSKVYDENSALLWASPPQPDPTYANAPGTPTYPAPPGGPENELYQLLYDEASRPANAPRGLAALSYVWAYRLFDSRTGRWSQLSERLESEPDAYGQSLKSLTASISFPMFQIIYDSARYDTVLLYRGLKVTGVTAEDTILSLEAAITLADYHIDQQPGGGSTYRRAAYFVTLSDAELSVQDTFGGDDSFLEEVPTAGALHLSEGTMLYGKTGQLDIEIGGLGVVRYSDLLKVSVELVPPLNRYPLKAPDEEVLAFADAGANVLGFTHRAAYLFRRFNLDLQGFRLHKGYGVVGQYAVSEIASNVYFVTPKGLKVIDAGGQLRSITAIDHIIQSEWQGELANVFLAYDEELSCLAVHNPTQEKTVYLWVETGKVTEVWDSVFTHVMEGDLPFDEDVCGSPYLRRACFLQEIPREPLPTYWRIFQIDQDRRKGNSRTLDPTGDVRVSSTGGYVGGTSLDITDGTLGTRLEGCYIYVLDGENAGAKQKIVSNTAGNITLENGLPTLDDGTRLGISPVYFRWMGHMLPIKHADGQVDPTERDLSRLRQADQVSCVFTDISGAAAIDSTNKDARFAASAWRANAAAPLNIPSFPIDPAGKGVKMISVTNGPSEIPAMLGETSFTGPAHGLTGSALFPAVEVYCPDLRFRLLEVNVSGMMMGTDRQGRPITRRV